MNKALFYFLFISLVRYSVSLSPSIVTSPLHLTDSIIHDLDVRCILSDVDGTLLSKKHTMDDVTHTAIKDIISRGLPFFPCTGRTRSSMASVLGSRFVNLFGNNIECVPGVYQQGLTVFGKGGELIFEQSLENDLIIKVVEFCDRHNIPLIGFAREDVFCRKRCAQTDKIMAWADPTPIEVPGGLHTLRAMGHAIQKLILLEDQTVLDRIRPLVEAEFKDIVSITTAVPGMLEILPHGSSKGFGVSVLLKHFGISPSHVIAFGDGENDIEMIEFVKHGVAMGNANTLLKKRAKYTTDHVHDHGVARVLSSILKKPFSSGNIIKDV